MTGVKMTAGDADVFGRTVSRRFCRQLDDDDLVADLYSTAPRQLAAVVCRRYNVVAAYFRF